MITTFIPYSPDGNLGRAYNECMGLLGPCQWGCFIDHDAAFTTPDWYKQLEFAIKKYPDAGVFTAMTNRIGNPDQRLGEPFNVCNDLKEHRRIGYMQAPNVDARDVTESKNLISGVVLCLSWETWKLVGGFCDGFLGVDNDMHKRVRDAGKRVYILRNLYVYHWYRQSL
jgi:GT2 family glycosyltransferase